jgi:predicted DNA-binding antitoxin AbrB/MazE fold protein
MCPGVTTPGHIFAQADDGSDYKEAGFADVIACSCDHVIESWTTIEGFDMQTTIEAIYVGGVLRPVEALRGIEENQRVTITVTASAAPNPLAGWVGGLSDEDARGMIRTIDAEFEKVNSDEWK